MHDGQLEAMLLTLVVEGIVAAFLARTFGLKPLWSSAAAVLGSMVTHPIVWWAYFGPLRHNDYWVNFAICETFAWLAEAIGYRLAGARWGNAIAISFVVNASSVIAGFIYFDLSR